MIPNGACTNDRNYWAEGYLFLIISIFMGLYNTPLECCFLGGVGNFPRKSQPTIW